MQEDKSIKISIHKSSSLTNNEKNLLKKMFNDEFGYTKLKWAKPEWYLIAKFNNIIIGRLGILQRKINIEKYEIQVAGITGAIIIKGYRGRKIFKKMIFKTYNFIINNLKLDFGLLLCKDDVIPIYEKCNWRKINSKLIYSQDSEIINKDYNIMIIELSNKKWPEGNINLNGLPW